MLKNHPDKAEESEKEKATKIYYDIVEAYEVLSDPEKKEKYDRGDDVDERPGFQGGPNPFHFNFANVKFNFG